jgi:hypothetical protein
MLSTEDEWTAEEEIQVISKFNIAYKQLYRHILLFVMKIATKIIFFCCFSVVFGFAWFAACRHQQSK